ncbi:MAG: hypothetical protein KAW88_00215 [Candidatus Cloacimonetes bacterium]|nr:hypothetical protein [Candidatus Cloacimonadota bacterium]
MRYRFLIILIIVSTSLLGNSIFSFEGMPVQYYGNDVYGLGMGETGSADLFRINPNFTNPSISISTNKVLFSTAVSMGYMWYKDDQGNKFRDDGLYFPYFTIAVPIRNHRFAFSFNTTSSGNLENERITTWESSFGDTLEYTEINRLSSNIYKADAIYSFKNPYINFGIALNYYIGHRIRYWKLDFDDIDYTDAKYEIEKTFKNPGFSLGMSKKYGNISFGAVYSSFAKLEGETKFKYGHAPYADTLDLADDFLFEVPQKISGGITWKFLEKYKASFDAYYEIWEETNSYKNNSYKFGFGLAYDPLSGYGMWYERIPLRIGGYIRELPFEKNNEKIMEQALTFGFSIPLKSPNKKIELALKYLTRGDVDKHGISDKSLIFSFGITGFDIFKKRPKKIEHRDIPKEDRR